jgi:hypothetical protein
MGTQNFGNPSNKSLQKSTISTIIQSMLNPFMYSLLMLMFLTSSYSTILKKRKGGHIHGGH